MINIARQKFSNLAPRDQRATLLLAAFFSILALIFLVILPAKKYYDREVTRFIGAEELNTWLVENESRLRTKETSALGLDSIAADQSLVIVVSESASSSGIKISRMEPQENRLIIQIEKTPFSGLIKWISELSEAKEITVQDISVNYISTNTVSARLVFSI